MSKLTAYELLNDSRLEFERVSQSFYDEELLPTMATGRTYPMDNSGDCASGTIREMTQWNPRSRIDAEQAYQQCLISHAGKTQRQLQPRKREHGD